MPEAREHPDDQDVEKLPPFSLPIASQGNVYIVPEPGAQGHMPSPPEFGDAAGNVGVVEVFREGEAEKLSKTNGHVAVAGEVKIDVQGVADGIEPGEENGRVLCYPPGGADLSQQVGQQHLFPQPYQKTAGSQPEIVQILGPVPELGRNVLVADNGSGDELGEEGDVAGQVNGVSLGPYLSPVYVYGIAEDLKGVEADADRQGQLQQGDVPPQAIEILQEEVGVFEIEEKSQAGGDTQNKQRLPKPPESLNGQPEAVAKGCGGCHDRQILWLPPGVKYQARQQQERVSGPARYQIAEEQGQGEKVIEEGNAGKNHGLRLPPGLLPEALPPETGHRS